MEFNDWLTAQVDREDEVGALARQFANGTLDLFDGSVQIALNEAQQEFESQGGDPATEPDLR